MAENFHADPDHIAGYAKLTWDTGSDVGGGVGLFITSNAKSDGGFSGVMSLLKGPVDLFADSTFQRLNGRQLQLLQTSQELTRSAWVYSGADESAYKKFSPYGGEAGYKDFPNPAPYPRAVDPNGELKVPNADPPDIRKLIDEVGGILNGIDDAVAFITGWSPVSALIEPLSGNWNALTKCGEALTNAGKAMEQAAGNLTKSLGTLDPHWNGGAAQGFTDYITKASAALEEEAPLYRVVAKVYEVVAGEVERVAKFMVDVLGKAADKIAKAAASWWIPGYGWYKVIDAVKTAIEIFIEAKDLVDRLETVIKQVEAVVEIAKDPVGAAQNKLEEKLAPYKEKAEQAQKTFDLTKDLADLADTKEFNEAPKTPYQAGADPRRPGA